MSDARVEQASRDRFPWSGLDQHIVGMSVLLQRIADLHEAAYTRMALPTYLLARWHSVDFGFSNGMTRKLERLAREIGRPSGDPVTPDSMPPHRLDLELGTEVPVEAAGTHRQGAE